MATVSIIIPVYNKAGFLRRCLDSIANQTDQAAQVILIDDGSTDNSTKICEDYCKKYGWQLYHTPHKGVSAARNLGIDKARGEYIAFMDADDTFEPDAVEIMTKISRHDYNIYQFGHYRYLSGPNAAPIPRCSLKGHYNLDNIIPYVSLVWNKLYKKSFLDENNIRFREDLQFGEDEIFNAECVLANGGLYQAPQILSSHYFDDKNSICRGHMCQEFVQGLYDALCNLARKQPDLIRRAWLNKMIDRHYRSNLFVKYNIGKRKIGKYDIVYFLKKSLSNEELRYSLRSIEENVPYHKVWFYGGCPTGIKPDYRVRAEQREPTKWERVRNMMKEACLNNNITENFWLFNDDFFVLRPITEDMPAIYDGTLTSKINEIEARHMDQQTEWTSNLRKLRKELKAEGKSELNYAVHKPMLVNRRKMLEVLDKFPSEPMIRALYGNYWEIGGINEYDVKIAGAKTKNLVEKVNINTFVSTSDESFRSGDIGRWLRDRFIMKSRFEV